MAKANDWSTNLMSTFEDMNIFLMGQFAMPALAAYNSLAVSEGKPQFGDAEKMNSTFASFGFRKNDGAFCLQTAICSCCPIVYPLFWRKQLREKYGIEGSCCGDCCVAMCCPACAVMQDARELKVRGDAWKGGFAATPTMG
eukprot:NODE_7583_length_756_cov_110.333333_g7334_i0.p2 GENE.NODE_7583_length_756_cov_110.333333_g7334_i0~~NODE_7583_length_756_cov_110.333333_g7334_i0.p2  ORF type:complete len:141 (-),score=47.20 NODE_7583_length_756_cov_110.333333_g7334_i0:268-690(-)